MMIHSWKVSNIWCKEDEAFTMCGTLDCCGNPTWISTLEGCMHDGSMHAKLMEVMMIAMKKTSFWRF